MDSIGLRVSVDEVGRRLPFVWTKMQDEGGQTLASILEIKNAERIAGQGVFWWGIGNSLGFAVREAAIKAGGTLPVVFSLMLSRSKLADRKPSAVYVWTAWKDSLGKEHQLPSHVLSWSRGAPDKKSHYALVCRCDEPLRLNPQPFEPSLCRTYLGNPLGASQVTALVEGDLDGDHSGGRYGFGFRATLIEPWVATLINPRSLSESERATHSRWRKAGDWQQFVSAMRGQTA